MTDKDFIIYEGKEGTFQLQGTYKTDVADIDAIFDHFINGPSKKMTLYFHGGLVGENSGRDGAYRIAPHIVSAGNVPVCFVWKTGLLEIVGSNLKDISRITIFQKVLEIIIKKVAQKLGFNDLTGRGASSALSTVEVKEELMKPAPFENYTRDSLPADGRGPTVLMDLPQSDYELGSVFYGDINTMIRQDVELVSAVNVHEFESPDGPARGSRGIISLALFVKSVVAIAVRVAKRFIEKRDHDFYPTIIEEIIRQLYIAELGAEIWNEMKVKASQMWEDNEGLTGDEQHAGRYFFDKLASYCLANPDVEINLVGHSAGSIAICHLLKEAAVAYPGLKFNEVIFLAPACRVDIFTAEVVKHPERYTNFRCFTMSNSNEKKDILVPGVYTHSLLYLISGILEQEGKGYDEYILGLERHICGVKPYDLSVLQDVHSYMYFNGANRTIYSETNPDVDAMSTHALKHGDFHDDTTTVASIVAIIK